MAHDLGGMIASEVTRAEGDFAAFRTRALSIVGVSGGLVTLVSGFLALAAGSGKPFLERSDRWALYVALAGYVGAVVVALLMNLPGTVRLSKANELKPLVDDHWDDEGWDQSVASFLLEYLVSLRAVNERSATLLTFAIGLEMVGIASTAVMAVLVVGDLPS